MSHPSTHPNATFKHLKTYRETEWLAHGKKRYRQVFAQGDTAYLYAELAVHNKQHDRMSWFATVTMACYHADVQGEQGAEVCVVRNEYPVSKDQAVLYIREGWGAPTPGEFWKAGRYVWHVWMDEHYLGQKVFFVEGPGNEADARAPYCAAGELRMYEGPKEHLEETRRRYTTDFRASDTRFVWAALQLENRMPERDWTGEFFIRTFNAAMELKGENAELKHVVAGTNMFELTAGWGSDTRGTWFPGTYSVVIVFMDQVIAHQTFHLQPDPAC